MSTSSYSFGDSPTAADRLAVLTRVFAPEMRAYLSQWAQVEPEFALDLGCGPGHTTHLLAECLNAGQTIGLDTSETFLAIAEQGSTETVCFLRHDVTAAPVPIGPAGVMFAHLLLYHLPDPGAVLATWGGQLRPGGLILVDDIEAVETDQPVLHRYLQIVGELVRHSGGNPSVGESLGRLGSVPGLDLATNDVIDFQATTADAATMFRMNLHTWRTHPYIVERFAASEIDDIGLGLDALRGADRRGDIHWRFRQMTFTKIL